MDKCLSSRLSYRLLSARKTAFVTSKKRINKINYCDLHPPDRDFRELSPRKRPPSLWVRESDSSLFTDSDCVIM